MQIQQRKKKQIKDIGYTVRMDEKLLDRVRAKASEKEMSINLLINHFLIEGIERK